MTLFESGPFVFFFFSIVSQMTRSEMDIIRLNNQFDPKAVCFPIENYKSAGLLWSLTTSTSGVGGRLAFWTDDTKIPLSKVWRTPQPLFQRADDMRWDETG